MPDSYKIEMTLDSDDMVELEVQDAVITPKELPIQLQRTEYEAMTFALSRMVPLLINANIKKLEIEREVV